MFPDLAVPLAEAGAATADRVGPKAATLGRLHRAGLPVPEGICLTAGAYAMQVALAGVADTARQVAVAEPPEARRRALAVRLGLTRVALDPALHAALDAAWSGLAAAPGAQLAVRSSALCEDTAPASFAGQFETYLGIAGPADLVTAVRACWASLWSSRALRYVRAHEVDPARSAMPVLVQWMVEAEAAGASGSLYSLLPSRSWGGERGELKQNSRPGVAAQSLLMRGPYGSKPTRLSPRLSPWGGQRPSLADYVKLTGTKLRRRR